MRNKGLLEYFGGQTSDLPSRDVLYTSLVKVPVPSASQITAPADSGSISRFSYANMSLVHWKNMFARVERWLLVLVPRSRGIVAPVDHGRDLLLPNFIHNHIRCTLFRCFALCAEEEGLMGSGIRWTLGSTLWKALMLSTLGFLEKRWKGGETCN